jgi:anti-sigma factor RsiW
MASLSIQTERHAGSEATAPECLAVRESLDAYVDGEAAEADTLRVSLHLVECDECRRAEHSLRRFLETVKHSQLSVMASRRLRLRVAQLFAAHDRSND